jgi:hypothetical protein
VDRAALALAILGVVFSAGAWIALMVVFFYLGRHR